MNVQNSYLDLFKEPERDLRGEIDLDLRGDIDLDLRAEIDLDLKEQLVNVIPFSASQSKANPTDLNAHLLPRLRLREREYRLPLDLE